MEVDYIVKAKQLSNKYPFLTNRLGGIMAVAGYMNQFDKATADIKKGAAKHKIDLSKIEITANK